jgi:hypothetical protein
VSAAHVSVSTEPTTKSNADRAKAELSWVMGPYCRRECVDERDGGLDPSGWQTESGGDARLLVRKRAPAARRVVFETGSLSVWFYHVLCAEGLPAICIDARHAKAALDMAANKTDANDADGQAAQAIDFASLPRKQEKDSNQSMRFTCITS